MNGRIYDPIISRFISADPFVQFPDNIQSYNRYAYVLNNPLTFTDPSGYIIPIIVGIMLVGLKVKCLVTIAVAMFIAGAAQAAIMGARGADILKAGLITAATAVVAAEIGSFFDIMGTEAAKAGLSQGFMNGIEVCRAAAHGISGGVFSEIGGGDFASGFLAGFAGSIAGSVMSSSQFSDVFGKAGQDMGIEQVTMRTVISATVGGTAAEIGGGKFMNGAMTAAVQHLFNAEGGQWMARMAGFSSSQDVLHAATTQNQQTGYGGDGIARSTADMAEGYASSLLIVGAPETIVGRIIVKPISRLLTWLGKPLVNKIPIWSAGKSGNELSNALSHYAKHADEFPEFSNANQYISGAKKIYYQPAKWNYD